MRFLKPFYLLFFFYSLSVNANNHYTDSLLKIIAAADDSLKIVNLNKLASSYSSHNIDSALFFAKKALQIARKKNNPYLISLAYYAHANIYRKNGQYRKELDYRKMVLEELLKTNDSNLIGRSYMDLGGVYIFLERFKPALENHLKSLEIFEKLKNFERLSACYVNVGNVYSYQNDFSTAIDYYLKAENIADTVQNKDVLATIYNNLGALYENIKDYKNAKIYITKSLHLRLQRGFKNEIAMAYGNLGCIYFSLNEKKEAIHYLTKSIALYKELNDKDGITTYMVSLASAHANSGNLDSALYYVNEGLPIAEQLQLKKIRTLYYSTLSEIYEQKKDFSNAFIFQKKLKLLNDTILKEDQNREVSELKNKYESTQKQREINELENQKLAQQLELEKQKKYKNILILGSLLLSVIILLFYNRFKLNKRSTNLLQAHNKEMALKNKEITDSIAYAKRIQTAILPSEKLIKQYLPNGFILYKPKDVVSGDFYWFHASENSLYVAAADCTGHGVPGAMVSVICNNALNRAVREFGLTIPNDILNKTRELVMKEFEKSDEEVKDGMDISLCKLESHPSGEYNLDWAGANNPLWIIKKNDAEITEYKPNKQPIGKTDFPAPFVLHSTLLQKGDTLYLFTDGYQDQFGGEKGKKFKAAQLKKILLSIQQDSMVEQIHCLETTFDKWRGNLEQVDDICIIGIRI